MKKITIIAMVLMIWGAADGAIDQLFAYYPFNGNANDETGGGHDGIVSGATLTNDRFGNPNSAYMFDGENDYIEILNPTDFAFEGSIKVSLWATFIDNANLYRYLSYFGETYNGNGPRYVIAKSRSGHMDGRIYTQVIPGDIRVTSLADGEQIPKDTWLHIVSIIDQETDTLSLYIDNVFQSSEPIGDFSLAEVCKKVFFGRSIAPDAVIPDWHYGCIDDVAIYVPEPSTLLLLGLGLAMLRRKKH